MTDPRYQDFFAVMDLLERNPQLLPADDLYDVDEQHLYAAILNRLSQPLPDGRESPFSSMAPGTAHAILVSAIAYMQALFGHQLNVKPDRELLQHYRLMGVEIARAEYPILSITFMGPVGYVVPANTEVRSRLDASLSVFTTVPGTIEQGGFVVIPARFNRVGQLPDIRPNEFTTLPRSLANVTAYNTGDVITPGRDNESIAAATLRARQQFQTGMRAVSTRDYYRFAMDFGATKTAVLQGIQYGSKGYFGDLITIVVYPPDKAPEISARFAQAEAQEPSAGAPEFSGRVAGGRLDIIGAEVVPVNGIVEVKADPQLSDLEVFNRAAVSISTQLNPPHGKWGDSNFAESLSTVLEYVEGIYAVPSTLLKRADTDEPLDGMEVHPWQLFEVQQSLQINVSRL